MAINEATFPQLLGKMLDDAGAAMGIGLVLLGASSTRLNGVTAARRTRENPPCFITSRGWGSPA